MVCDDNGTPNDPSDDTFSFNLTATGGTGPWGWDMLPGVMMFPYGMSYSFGPFPVSGGSVSVTINDHDNPFCTATVLVDPPPCQPGPLPEPIVFRGTRINIPDQGKTRYSGAWQPSALRP